MQFTIQQRITIWQEIQIDAPSKEQAIEMVKADPQCSNFENEGILMLNETEEVLQTELYEGDYADKVAIYEWEKTPSHRQTYVYLIILHEVSAYLNIFRGKRGLTDDLYNMGGSPAMWEESILLSDKFYHKFRDELEGDEPGVVIMDFIHEFMSEYDPTSADNSYLYILFGSEAVALYFMNDNEITEIDPEKHSYTVYKYDSNESIFSGIPGLLGEADGWGNYAIITAEQYNLLSEKLSGQ